MTGTKKTKFLLLIASSIILSSCSSVSNVSVNKSFPDVLFSPKELKVAIIFTDEFSQFVGKPNDKTTIDLGLSQVNLFKSAFKGLFSEVYFIENTDQEPSLEQDSTCSAYHGRWSFDIQCWTED